MTTETTLASLADVRAAAAAIGDRTLPTPLLRSDTLDRRVGAPISLKAENFQKTGSFKLRGACYFLHRLSAADRARGVCTASAGNHAQGIALASRLADTPATVFMPVSGSIAKVQATRNYGARVVLAGRTFDEANEAALAHAEETGARYVSAFDHPDIIAGQGTVALEILAELPGVRTVIVPVGGGGLISGMAAALKEARPEVRIVGVQAAYAPAAVRSWQLGALTPVEVRRSIADGVAVKHPSELTFRHLQRFVDDMVVVDEDAIARTILFLLERQKILVEGAGAVALAALLEGLVRPRGETAVVLSGGNIDIRLLSGLIERGMQEAGRYLKFHTEIDDLPGSLARLLQAIADQRGNLITVNHDRTGAALPFGHSQVELLVEAHDQEHVDAMIAVLHRLGYVIRVLP